MSNEFIEASIFKYDYDVRLSATVYLQAPEYRPET